MPFTLAHPAAVLPFKRFCPRYLTFPALIAGSVSPDASYFFGRLDLGPFAHHPIKGFLFGIPAGLVILAAFYVLRSPALKMLPHRYREIFQPLVSHPIGTPLAILLSLTIGVAHILSYICSFLGVFWLCLTYSRWRATEPPRVQLRNSFFVGALVFPI